MTNLQFAYKELIAGHHLQVPYRDLKIDKKKSFNHNKKEPLSDNLIIHGDNLEALKSLLPKYAGRVNCIYIDPPYNTGNEGWAYNDNMSDPVFKQWLKKTVDSEDLERHDKWCCMMWPRLQLLKELLTDDGVIFVSIGNDEQQRLKMMMDEIFEEEQHLSTIVVRSNPGGRDYGGIAQTHDYVLVYGKETCSKLDMIPVDEDTLPLNDENGGFELRELRNRNKKFNKENRPNLFYPFYVDIKHKDKNNFHPVSVFPKKGWIKVYPEKTEGVQTVWRWSKKKVHKNNNDVVSRKKRGGKFGIWEKYRRTGKRQRSIFYDKKYRTENGTLLLKEIFGTSVFPYPKSCDLIKDLLLVGTEKNSIVLDSFTGSGTTAHAVLNLNKEDGGDRKFILIECEDYADTITAERVRRIIKGVPNAKDENLQKGLGGSFTYCTLGNPIDTDKMLTGESLPEFESLASFLLHKAHGISTEKSLKSKKDGLFYSTDTIDYYLLYKPDVKYLRSISLTEKKATSINKKGKEAIVFAPDKEQSQRELSALKITFCRLPDVILRNMGGSI